MPGEPIFTIRRMVTSSAALRELNYMAERYKSTWAEELSALLREAITLKKKLTEFSSHQAEKGVAAIEFHLDRLLETTLNLTHKEAVSFQKRLLKNRNSVLTFLHQPKVLPDNNRSEGAYGLVHESLRLFCSEADFTKLSGTLCLSSSDIELIRSILAEKGKKVVYHSSGEEVKTKMID
jgi:hypothetical protein